MAFVPAYAVARFAVEQKILDQTAVNVFWVRDNTLWDASKLIAASNVFINAWDADLQAFLSDHWTLEKVVSQDYTTYNGVSMELTPVALLQGTGAGDPLPPQNALVVSWRTANRGRSFRGRSYMTGLTEFYQDNGKMGTPVLDAFETWATNLIAAFTAAGQSLGVCSFFAAGQPRQAGYFTPYTTFRVRDIIYTQRRRTLGVGG